MKEINKKGFFSISIIYSFLILFILLLLGIVSSYVVRDTLIGSIVKSAQEDSENDPLEMIYGNKTTLFNYDASKKYQEYVVPKDGIYKIELWGAQGGTVNTSYPGKYGAYTSGEINLEAGTKLYFYIGGSGVASATSTTAQGGYNGGGIAPSYSGLKVASGGGATDVRLVIGDWDDKISLRSRIMVAAGGSGGSGSSTAYYLNQGYAGGLSGTQGYTTNTTYNTTTYPAGGGTQTSGGVGYAGRNGSFGKSYQGTLTGYCSGGGSGYYGGANGFGRSGGGGSSYISGHTGCVAVQEETTTPLTGCTTGTTNNSCSIHYSEKVFNNTVMIDGIGYSWSNTKGTRQRMPSTTQGSYYNSGVGQSGNGSARITQIKNSTDFVYTNKYEKYVVPKTGTYKIELWGAQGGSVNATYFGGYGGYVAGEIFLKVKDILYIYVGGSGTTGTAAVVATYPGGYNGGGNGYVSRTTCSQTAASGGGATDVRLVSGAWNNATSLNSRIMVAAGGGGSYAEYCSTTDSANIYGGMAGGLIGYTPIYKTRVGYSTLNPTGGNQLNGGQGLNSWKATAYVNEYKGTFGKGGTGANSYSGGAGGYYGGSSGVWQPGAGGSSYISGHTGCIAIKSDADFTPRVGTGESVCDPSTNDIMCSEHYSSKTFINTIMIDGNGYEWTNVKGSLKAMPNPFGGYYASGKGHSGSGMAKITLISLDME